MYLPADGSCGLRHEHLRCNFLTDDWSGHSEAVKSYLEEGVHVRLRRYGLYGVLGLGHVGAIDVDVRGGDVSRVALAIGRRPGVGLLRLRRLQATAAEQIAIVVAGPRQLFLHVVQAGERQFRQLRRVRRAIRVRHESLHTRVGRYHVHPVVFPVKHVHYLKRF